VIYTITPGHDHSIAERRAQSTDDPQIKKLHAALAPYIDLAKLRDLAAQSEDLYAALRCDNPPEEVLDLVRLLYSERLKSCHSGHRAHRADVLVSHLGVLCARCGKRPMLTCAKYICDLAPKAP
jgi:hypothetical protein